jgi:hypothetical protein
VQAEIDESGSSAQAAGMTAPLNAIRGAALNPTRLGRKVIKDRRLVPAIANGLEAEQLHIKYGCAKALRFISESRPDVLYPHFDLFVGMLEHENKILQWNAIFVLSHLVRVDVDDKFPPIFQRYFSPIPGPVMITAANVIQGGARIAQARPGMADRISAKILRVGAARYQTPECRNVAIGHAIVALGTILPLLRRPAAVVRFVRKQLKNSRPATRKKAEKFVKAAVSAMAHWS